MKNKTYPRVRQILQDDVRAMGSVNAVVRKTGLTHNTIGKYLDGLSQPQEDTLLKLAHVYGKSVAWLRGDSESQALEPHEMVKNDFEVMMIELARESAPLAKSPKEQLDMIEDYRRFIREWKYRHGKDET